MNLIGALILGGTWLAWMVALLLLVGCHASDATGPRTRQIVCTDYTANSAQQSTCVTEE